MRKRTYRRPNRTTRVAARSHLERNAAQAGLSRRAITDRAASGRLVRVHHGVYFVGHAGTSPLAIAEAAVIHEARRNHHLAGRGLRRLLQACPRAAELVDPGQPPSESALEDAFRVFLKRRNIPEPGIQVVWHGHRVDARYRDHNLIIELDGRQDHGQWDRIERDHVRDALAIEHRRDTLRITWRRLRKEADELERQLRAILAARAPDARR